MAKKYEILLKEKRLEYEKLRIMERNSRQIMVLLIINIITLFYINHIMKICDISIIINFNLFYIIIFSLILTIGFIYSIIKRKIFIDIILYIKIFLFLNIIFLIYSFNYILYLHSATPYISLIKILNLVEINHKITVDFAVYCAKEYCSRFGLVMIEELDIVKICNMITDFNLIEIELQLRNQRLLEEFAKMENEKAQKGTFSYGLQMIISYIPHMFSISSILVSYAHTPMICFNIFDWSIIILLQENFPKEIFDDFGGLFYFLYPEIDEAGDFAIGLI